jgi:hypothetical protein
VCRDEKWDITDLYQVLGNKVGVTGKLLPCQTSRCFLRTEVFDAPSSIGHANPSNDRTARRGAPQPGRPSRGSPIVSQRVRWSRRSVVVIEYEPKAGLLHDRPLAVDAGGRRHTASRLSSTPGGGQCSATWPGALHLSRRREPCGRFGRGRLMAQAGSCVSTLRHRSSSGGSARTWPSWLAKWPMASTCRPDSASLASSM